MEYVDITRSMKIFNNIGISINNQQNAYFEEENSLIVDVSGGGCNRDEVYSIMMKTDVKLMTKIAKSINLSPKIDFNDLWL